MTSVIYALTDPDNGAIRYIGKTNVPKRRLRLHLTEVRTTTRISHRLNWLRALMSEGKKPGFIVLEECNNATWVECERKWIAKFRNAGANLVNNTDGGEGGNGYKHSKDKIDKIAERQLKSWADPETKIRRSLAMRGIKKSDTRNMAKSFEARAKMSMAHKGKKHFWRTEWTPERRQRLSKALRACGHMARTTSFKKGMVLSEEAKRKLSQIRRGTVASEETKRKISLSCAGEKNGMFGKHHTKETRKKISLLVKAYNLRTYGNING